ncbi:MAG: methylmalonyl-CoA mutase C-terminal domain [bacterium]|nr:MAG: methylmalonyl-CoA mutase C-terminal domain [bacterium]
MVMEGSKKKTRVLMGILGIDIHRRGAEVVSKALRDAGAEVIYMGYCLTPEMIVDTAIQEDVDVIGLSTHCGYHRILFPKEISLLRERKVGSVRIVAGGTIPVKDKAFLEDIGVTGNFGPGTSIDVIVDHILN